MGKHHTEKGSIDFASVPGASMAERASGQGNQAGGHSRAGFASPSLCGLGQ